jgi:cytoplasmic iron level regulating protein YaaA (DUF328/UPF0246 family)
MLGDFSPHLKEDVKMTPEKRIDRAERMIKMLARAGRRVRQEWGEKVNILINAQIETEEQMHNLAAAQAELARSQKLTDQALRAFINSLRKGRYGKSSN